MPKPFIVAELSANHLGDLTRALQIIDSAAKAGADAVKVQTWDPGRMVVDEGYIVRSGPWEGRLLVELYREAFTPCNWWPAMQATAAESGIELFSSVFDEPSLEFLEAHQVQRHKIASFELVDLPLIRVAAATGKPLILSAGMATLVEINDAVLAAQDAGCHDFTLLRCVSAYPARPGEACLATMADLRGRYGCKVGLSDHSLGLGVAVAAAALGADMIEKHLTLRRLDGGPDAAFSMEPDEFADMVVACRQAAQAVGEVRYGPTKHEEPQLALRRSLWWVRDLPQGHIVVPGDLVSARPADGLPPKAQPEVLGRYLNRDVKRGEPVTWDTFASGT